RLRGQGSGTLLLSRNPGSVIEMDNGSDVTLENFAVLGAAGGSTTTAVVAARNMLGLVVRNLVLVGVASGDATSAALSVTGYLLGGRVEDSVLIAERGVVGLDGDEEALLLGHWGMTNNLVFASQRGISFGGNSFYFSGVRLRDNLVLGTSDRGIGVTGGALLDCGVDVTGNTIYTSGDGIVCGASRVRIRGNDLLPMTQTGGNGIVVETGAEADRIEALSIMDNRVTGIDGHGVVIRAPVGDGMIKQNRFERLGGGGVVVEPSGSAGYLVIENNHFFDIGRVQEDTDRGYAGLDLVGVERADVLNNVMVDIASGAVASPRIDAVLIAGSEHLRLGGNRIEGVGADRGAGLIAAIHVDTPVSQLQIDGNSISRSSSQRQLTGDANWLAVLVDARPTDRAERTDVAGERVAAAPDLRRAAPSVASRAVSETPTYAYVRLDNRVAFVTPHRVAVRDATPDSTLLRGNYLTAAVTSAPLVALAGIESCTLVENDCRSPGAGTGRNLSLLGIAMADYVNLSNNRLVGAGDVDTFDIRSERFAATGNLSTGNIQVFGAPLPAPWDQFNAIGG
ncbi:MAG: right-handed parallel beta-helix repeat-containing protein, partial [Pseudomonadota bacterium]|nr:right-handed parallel beta-helix repeat-containing protein [Pseudomonadota bacterium]